MPVPVGSRRTSWRGPGLAGARREGWDGRQRATSRAGKDEDGAPTHRCASPDRHRHLGDTLASADGAEARDPTASLLLQLTQSVTLSDYGLR